MPIATWRKCDFQIHSPRDPNWIGQRPIGIGESVGGTGVPATQGDVESARQDWAVEFIDACIKRGLRAIAITDHHEMVILPYVQEAAAARNATTPDIDIWVFPGMELTAKNGVQCLAIFDSDFSEQWCQQAMGKLGIQYAEIDKNSSRGIAVTQLTSSYKLC